MSKRKANGDGQIPTKDKMDVDGEDSGSDEVRSSELYTFDYIPTTLQDIDMINVDFEFFDPQPDIDFHGLKALLRQLFDVDNQLFDLSALTDLILSQPLVGSTVKTDGKESDPFAFLTVLNLRHHREKPVIQELIKYLTAKAKASGRSELQQLEKLLGPSSDAQVGLILPERVINMPHQIVPNMYNLLLEEIDIALADKSPYAFTHYLIISKTYVEVASKLDAEDNPPSKKKKAGPSNSETFFFHPEDEVFHKHAVGFTNFEYDTKGDEGASDAKRAFSEMGIQPQGHMILVEGKKNFGAAVKAVGEYLKD